MKPDQSVPAFELARAGQYPPIITFEYADGGSHAFRYEEFRTIRYYPSDSLKLHFTTAIVTLHGRNLLPIWRAIRSRRVSLLRVGSAAPETEPTDNKPHIESIFIADRTVKK